MILRCDMGLVEVYLTCESCARPFAGEEKTINTKEWTHPTSLVDSVEIHVGPELSGSASVSSFFLLDDGTSTIWSQRLGRILLVLPQTRRWTRPRRRGRCRSSSETSARQHRHRWWLSCNDNRSCQLCLQWSAPRQGDGKSPIGASGIEWRERLASQCMCIHHWAIWVERDWSGRRMATQVSIALRISAWQRILQRIWKNLRMSYQRNLSLGFITHI